MSKFTDFVEQMNANKQSKNFSKSDMVGMTAALLNDPDADVITYVKKGDTYEVHHNNPSRDVRENVYVPLLKAFGVDRAEMAKLEDYKISKAGAEALTDLNLLVTKMYIAENGLGRKLTLPMTSPTEAVQSISIETVPQDVKQTTMIVKNEDGTYSSKPTGKEVTTAPHARLKASNRVPAWLKDIKDVK